MKMIGLHGQSKDCPSLLLAFLLNQLLATLSNIPNQHRLSPSWTPDEMIHHQVDVVFIPLIFKRLFHCDVIHEYRQKCKLKTLAFGALGKLVGHSWLKPHLTAQAKAMAACGGLKP
jgi:hypothetical protein